MSFKYKLYREYHFKLRGTLRMKNAIYQSESVSDYH